MHKKKANKKWRSKNPEKTRLMSYKRSARTYVRRYASHSDIRDLIELFNKENPNDQEEKFDCNFIK
ncbi:MAG: hypothetical protein Q4B52_07745 [Tissierellia bacterium]|nr:hypothetical protein [Tissierellia bacterium]